MAEIKQFKVVASLPSPLEPNSIYYVRVGQGYDQYVTNGVGVVVAYEANSKLDLENKVDKEEGKQLSDENFTLDEKNKLASLENFEDSWATAKAALLGNVNIWSQPQIIHQGDEDTTLGLFTPTDENVSIQFASSTGSETPVTAFLGMRTDGTLGTGPSSLLYYDIHTSNTLPVRSTNNVNNYSGNGVTLAEDERAALELGPPVSSANTVMLPGRNRNIVVNGIRTVVGSSQHFGTGATASMTIRSSSTNSRTIYIGDTIINKSDYNESYEVTDTDALYLEGRYIEQGFVITFLTMIPIVP